MAGLLRLPVTHDGIFRPLLTVTKLLTQYSHFAIFLSSQVMGGLTS
jgi:hypothetical protein